MLENIQLTQKKSEKKQQKNEDQMTQTKSKILDSNPYISIMMLNRNRLNIPIKRHRLSEWISKKTQLYDI